MTSSKTIPTQIATIFDTESALKRIRRGVDCYDDYIAEEGDSDVPPATRPHRSKHIQTPRLESPNNAMLVESFTQAHAADPIFQHFDRDLIVYLRLLAEPSNPHASSGTTSEPASQGITKYNTMVSFRSELGHRGVLAHHCIARQITPHKLLRVPFTSCDDWMPCYDLVRCNPKFHGRPRFDCVLINDEHGTRIGYGRLAALFSCSVLGHDFNIAFVLRSDIVTPASDVDIGLSVVREREIGEFILVDRIIRAAQLISTFAPDHPRDFFLNDLVDYDMILRLDTTYNHGV